MYSCGIFLIHTVMLLQPARAAIIRRRLGIARDSGSSAFSSSLFRGLESMSGLICYAGIYIYWGL